MLRVIKEFKPTWVIGENVAGILNMAQRQGESDMESETDNDESCGECGDSDGIVYEIIRSIEQIGYSVQAFVIPAVSVNAPHRRDRVWFVAHSEGERSGRCASKECCVQERKLQQGEPEGREVRGEGERRTGDAADSESKRSGGIQEGGNDRELRHAKCGGEGLPQKGGKWDQNWLEVATSLCGVDDGLPAELDGLKLSKSRHRVERLKALGNAIVPQVVVEIMRAIKEIECSKP